VVAQVLQTAASVTMGENAAFDMLDYVISLREGIMDAWSGAILSMKSKRKHEPFRCDLADVVQPNCCRHMWNQYSRFSVSLRKIQIEAKPSCGQPWV